MLSPVILVIHTDDSVMSALHIKLVIYSQLDIVGIDLINMSLSKVFSGHSLKAIICVLHKMLSLHDIDQNFLC